MEISIVFLGMTRSNILWFYSLAAVSQRFPVAHTTPAAILPFPPACSDFAADVPFTSLACACTDDDDSRRGTEAPPVLPVLSHAVGVLLLASGLIFVVVAVAVSMHSRYKALPASPSFVLELDAEPVCPSSSHRPPLELLRAHSD